MSGAYNAAQLNIDGILGGYLAHEFVPAKTHEGAVGGALFGAIGNLILPGGLGSFIGTLLGTLIFNHFGTSPSPGAVDLLDQAGYFYNYHQYQASDHGTYDFPDKMAPAADAIINVYLKAVNGAALDHSKQVTLGYIVNPDLLFITGGPGHSDRSFTNADDAVHAAALDVLQNTEVIGGDLLLKRAHHNSSSGPHRSRNHGANERRHFRVGGWRAAKAPIVSMAFIHKRVRVIGDPVRQTRIGKIHTEFAHGPLARIGLACPLESSKSFIGRNSIRSCSRQNFLQSSLPS